MEEREGCRRIKKVASLNLLQTFNDSTCLDTCICTELCVWVQNLTLCINIGGVSQLTLQLF